MSLDRKRGYGWKQDAKAMKNLNKGTDQAVKMTGLITRSRKANKTHRQSPEVHTMSKPGSGVRTNARILNIPYFAVWSLH